MSDKGLINKDNDEIDKMIKRDIEAIESLPDDLAIEYIKRNPKILSTEFFRKRGLREYYIDKDPELFNSLTENGKLQMVFIDEKHQFIKELDEETQTRILTTSESILIPVSKQKAESATFLGGEIISKENLPGESVLVSFRPNSRYFRDNLDLFSENVIYNIVRNNIEIAKEFNFKKLPTDVQVNIASIDNSLLVKMDKVAIENFFGGETVTLKHIVGLNISNADKLKLVNALDIPISMKDLDETDMDTELAKMLLGKVPEEKVKEFFNEIVPDDTIYDELTSDRYNQVKGIISKFGREIIYEYLSEDKKKICSLVCELSDNFEKEQISALIDKRQLEMNFLEKNSIFNKSSIIRKYLIEINQNDNGLAKLRSYCDFRENNNGLDFCESLYKSVDEYRKYGKLYFDLLENFNQLSDDEKAEFADRWTDLINLDNKFNIQNIQDFKRFDEIEKEYYSKRINNSENGLKRDICEILVRNLEIFEITRLGNGTEYTTNNKDLEDVVDILSTLNEITDLETLKGILNDCIGMIGSDELKTIRSIGRNIEEKLIQVYREGYIDGVTNYDDMSDEELSKIEGIRVERINNVRIIHLEGANFSLIAHTGSFKKSANCCCCSLITNDNYVTFGSGPERDLFYVFSKFSPNRIKLINMSDAGHSDYKDTYISQNDLALASKVPKSEMEKKSFNEVRFSTKEEIGDDELNPSARITFAKEFDSSMVDRVANSKTTSKTIYVLHDEIYNEQNKMYEMKKEELTNKYLQSLDPKFLDLLLREAEKDENTQKETNNEMKKIEDAIRNHIDDKFGKNVLRRNLSRYWQLSRRKLDHHLSFDTSESEKLLRQKLEQMDNEFLKEDGFKDRIKEVAEKYGDER